MQKKIDLNLLGKIFKKHLKEAEFAYLYGSAQKGVLKSGSDIDIAFYIKPEFEINADLILKINSIFATAYPDLTIDISFLNNASVILQFEALKGVRLFVRDDFVEQYSGFFSLVARQYEDEMYHRNQQLKYRGYRIQDEET